MLSSSLRTSLRNIPSSSSYRCFSTSRVDFANTLLFLEHKKGVINPASRSAITAATKLGGDIHGLLVGTEKEAGEVLEKAKKWVESKQRREE